MRATAVAPRTRVAAIALRTASAALVALAVTLCGCARRSGDGPVPIRVGAACAGCGMEVRNLKFACEVVRDGRARVFDSIECLQADAAPRAAAPAARAGRVYLTDYDHGALIPLDRAFVVRGRFPTPMGGGLAAFSDSSAAAGVAAQTQGQVRRGLLWWNGAGGRIAS